MRRSREYVDQLGDRLYRSRRQRIERRVEELLKDPYAAAGAERLRYRYWGLRSARVLDDVRLIYRVCAECRAEEMRQPKVGAPARGEFTLDCCADGHTVDDTVNILCLSQHYVDIPSGFDFHA